MRVMVTNNYYHPIFVYGFTDPVPGIRRTDQKNGAEKRESSVENRTVLITGASRGIGAAIAEQFASEGYRLALNALHKEQLEATAQRIRTQYGCVCRTFPGDVGDAGFVRTMIEQVDQEMNGTDILVNNAGISVIGLLDELSEEEWDRIVRTNLTSVFLCCKYAVRSMLQKKSGRVINISSVWGEEGASCEVAYSATKGGVNALTKGLAKELAPSNIQVNAIACGVIDTAMNQCFSREERKALEEEIPTGRYGTAQETAQMVSLLAKAPDYLTGQVITLDGGWT